MPAVFDFDKLAWMNRQYMKQLPVARMTAEASAFFVQRGVLQGPPTAGGLGYVESLLPMVVGSVDRLEEIPDRVAFLFDWDSDVVATLLQQEPEAARIVLAFVDAVARRWSLGRPRHIPGGSRCRAGGDRPQGQGAVSSHACGLTGADSGPELDLAVPAIERGALLEPSAGLLPVLSCLERARAVAARFR